MSSSITRLFKKRDSAMRVAGIPAQSQSEPSDVETSKEPRYEDARAASTRLKISSNDRDGDEYAEPYDIRSGPNSHTSNTSPSVSLGTPTHKNTADTEVRYTKPRDMMRASQGGSVSRPSSPRPSDRARAYSNGQQGSMKAAPDDDYQDPFDARTGRDALSGNATCNTAPPSVACDDLFLSSDNADYCRPKDSLAHPSSHPNSRHPGLYSDFRPPTADTSSLRGRSETGSSLVSQKSGASMRGTEESDSPSSDMSLESFGWFHGAISRDAAESMLIPSPDCSFLVRVSESRPTDFSLSLRNNGQLLHLKIIRRPDGMYIMGQNSKPFRSVVEMIGFYQRHRMLIKGAEHIRLLYIIPKGGAKASDFDSYAQPRDHL